MRARSCGGPASRRRRPRTSWRSRCETYRAGFPGGRFHIVECDGAPIGRLVEADEADLVHIVDLAILPALRRRGHAVALLRAALTRWAAAGRGARAHVHVGNEASLRLFHGLGFVGTPDAGAAQVTLRWPSMPCAIHHGPTATVPPRPDGDVA